jgi:hypothetical protein
MAFAQRMRLAGHDLRCADDALEWRSAVRTRGKRWIRKPLQDFDATAATRASGGRRRVFVDRHDGKMRPQRRGIKRWRAIP